MFVAFVTGCCNETLQDFFLKVKFQEWYFHRQQKISDFSYYSPGPLEINQKPPVPESISAYAFKEVHNLQSDLVQQKRTAELKEAAESSKDTTPGSTTTTTTTDVHSDDQLQGSTDDNSPSLLLLPSSTPTIISEVGCKIFLVI